MNSDIILAEFSNPADLLSAAKTISNHGYQHFDAHSPFPIHGMDDAMNLPHSKLPWIVLVGGIIGLFGGFGMQVFMSWDYKIIISGKPFLSYPAFIPVTFEIMVLISAFATVFGMFFLNKLPEHYHPIFKSDNFRKVTSHGFFISILSSDPGYDEKKICDLLVSINGKNIEVIREDQ